MVIERISREHDRKAFRCGEADLDGYLIRFARQNDESGISRCYVMVEEGARRVWGYYTLSMGYVEIENLPEADRKRLPHYPIPVAHLGRLAVDEAQKGRGCGEWLLMDALRQVSFAAERVGAYAVEVRAKTEGARRFYLQYGFVSLRDDPLHMYLKMETIQKLGLL